MTRQPKPPARQITAAELAEQQRFGALVRQYYLDRYADPPLAFVRTFGCQQNVADSERLCGMLAEMGFGFTDTPEGAAVILFNTCAVREHAEDRVFGNLGALKAVKRRRPGTLIGVCGCMAQQEHVAARLKASFPHVGLVFGTHVLHRLPELIWEALTGPGRVIEIPEDAVIAEDIPVRRDGRFKAWLPVMYGCDNFCSYCVVPYVRGRERSRDPAVILREAEELAAAGYKEITLLGQNVNSYAGGITFPQLLERINAIPGDFLIRFMTSHPKDATPALFDAIAACEKVARHFHLPFQSGSDRILEAMNRGYTRAHYLSLIQYAKDKIPGVTFTSDVIVGFPGEERADFEQTLDLLRRVEFASLFTFIFSPRKGTPAAALPDPTPAQVKSAWFAEMTALQEEISGRRLAQMVGQTRRVLIESAEDGQLETRLPENTVIRVPYAGDPAAVIGRRAWVTVTQARSWMLQGVLDADSVSD
ncbi:MAG: tRNA (N6-isopentenyl adenosine(37)-C2)-methylthiotransferase MiaB [Oscillospiraceae bacterium]|nr:tRNA (N6-isopentenyl adenosine(37)-C2)-methylthiotransferase MiaB [Oscillospiraceae bacterium]